MPSQSATEQQLALRARLQQTQFAYHQAAEVEKFKSGFLARSSHELRSPINSVISLHQLILSDLCEDPAEEREFIAQAQAAAEKMLALLDRLIGLSKMSYGLELLQPESLRLEDVFAEVEYSVQLLAQNRNIRLEITPPDPELYVWADPRWLRQILVSLMDAPILLMQEGYVRLKSQVDLDNQQVQIWVEDQRPPEFWSESVDLLEVLKGQGIRSSHSEHQEVDKIPSPGLSLLIVQTLLDAVGGRLEILATPLTALPEPSLEILEPNELSEPTGSEAIAQSPLQLPNLTRIQCSLPLAVTAAKAENLT
ncbi:MAG: HAMP domain-containing histidine kinase [Drouetiella hepatica Uher 2000/2452]|uniref:histidine kinase n=1 Tax=Drouetiella hepatica Uher 2000/2452 TaxID=904376 RepID=A0A951QBV6_9CYAN|nr:HAMP domain-containing histidine kinase [Drouetiella hepatica Uher 2000/2452]